MQTANGKDQTSQLLLTHSCEQSRKPVGHRNSLFLLIALAWVTCGASYAQLIVGSPGAGFQSWTASADLNNNHAPYWDNQSISFVGDPNAPIEVPTNKNAGYCLTATGDCVGILSAAFAPGALPFWSMPYDSVHDSGGAIDPNFFFFKPTDSPLKATLQLQLSSNTLEINEFGWFETNGNGTVLGPRHTLFQGSGVTGTGTPTPVGTTVTFKPTKYFGYYIEDVSEFTSNNPDGCLVYTLSRFNTATDNCVGHTIVVFASRPGSVASAFWIAGEETAICDVPGANGALDDDCNFTLVKVDPAARR